MFSTKYGCNQRFFQTYCRWNDGLSTVSICLDLESFFLPSDGIISESIDQPKSLYVYASMFRRCLPLLHTYSMWNFGYSDYLWTHRHSTQFSVDPFYCSKLCRILPSFLQLPNINRFSPSMDRRWPSWVAFVLIFSCLLCFWF